jgi:DNA polymerase III delta prime subunit
MAFKKAEKKALHIKIALSGPSGCGKTYSALRLAKGLGGKIAVLDTESGSASLYSDKFDFDTYDEKHPQGYPPEFFISAIKCAEEAGYEILIIDSLSHEWMGRGGCLEIATHLGQSKYRGNSFAAWKDVTPRHQALIDAILSSKIHIIATMRSKIEYETDKDDKGKSKVDKLGLAPVQRDGMDYEFTIMFEIDRDSHIACAGKDRTSLFADPHMITEGTGGIILKWLSKPSAESKADSETKPKQKDEQESWRKANDYITMDICRRMDAGEMIESIQMDYAQILGNDMLIKVEELASDEVISLARSLYKRDKLNKGA